MQSVPITQTLPSFDDLVELAKNDPEAFDSLKHNLCEEMILSASQEMQGRLRAQQSHIDLVISHCKNPNHVNVELMRELAVQINKFQEALDGSADESPANNADIIPIEQWR